MSGTPTDISSNSSDTSSAEAAELVVVAAEDVHTEKKKSSKTILAIVFLLLLLGGGGVAYFLQEEPAVEPEPDIVYLRLVQGVDKDAVYTSTLQSPDRSLYLQFEIDKERCMEAYGDKWQGCFDRKDKITEPVAYPKPSQNIELTWTFKDRPSLEITPVTAWMSNESYAFSIPKNIFGAGTEANVRTVKVTIPNLYVVRQSLNIIRNPSDPTFVGVNGRVEFPWAVDKKTFEEAFTWGTGASKELKLGETRFSWNNSDTVVSISAKVENLPVKASELNYSITKNVYSQDGNSFIGKDAKSKREPVYARATISGKDDVLQLESVAGQVITNPDTLKREQFVFLTFNINVEVKDITKYLDVQVLPRDRKGYSNRYPYNWLNAKAEDMSAATRDAQSIKFEVVNDVKTPTTTIQIKHNAEAGRVLLVDVARGLPGVGGFVLKDNGRQFRAVPYPQAELVLMQPGNILAATGDQKLALMSVGHKGISYEARRIKPQYLSQLMSFFGDPLTSNANIGSQTLRSNYDGEYYEGDYYEDESYGSSTKGNTDIFYDLSEVERGKLPLGAGNIWQPKFTSFDIRTQMPSGAKGIFHVIFRGEDPERGGSVTTSRFIMVTDLGIIHKRGQDGKNDIFVSSLSTGNPVVRANVRVLGRNGTVVAAALTDSTGRAALPNITKLRDEKQAEVIIVENDQDLTFIPVRSAWGTLSSSDFSSERFSGDVLDGLVFSERGIFRPGEELRFGFVVKRGDFNSRAIAGLPLRFVVMDSQGTTIHDKPLTLSQFGIGSIEVPTKATAPSGRYHAELRFGKGNREGSLLASAGVQVEEFQPETMKIDVSLSEKPAKGWLLPSEVMGIVSLQNLYGTPAADHAIQASITLRPAIVSLSTFPQYTFFDPLAAQQSVSDSLAAQQTDAAGLAKYDLNLQKYATGSYWLNFDAEGFEAGGGRSVVGFTRVLVSPHQSLIGFRVDSTRDWYEKNSDVAVDLIAVDRNLTKVVASDLKLNIVAVERVATLVHASSGFRYDYSRREKEVHSQNFTVAQAGSKIFLPTEQTGEYEAQLINKEGQVLCRIPYTVGGVGFGGFGYSKEAILRTKTDTTAYEAGDTIEVYVNAPYTGAGLLTLETDKVIAHTWFKSTTNETIQRIVLPEGTEGKVYVGISFVRDLASREIYMSPHSHAYSTVMVGAKRRDLDLGLNIPAKIEPGQTLEITVNAKEAGSAIVYAVDEGVLQLTKYVMPRPLRYFFNKQMLSVRTMQTFSLLMPEHSFIREAIAAFGGDMLADEKLEGHLNPFARKAEKSVVYWSGVVALEKGANTFSYTVPEYFNGSLRVMAVGASSAELGSISKNVIVRNDLIISPTIPVAVAPGDEFEVTVSLANNIEGSGKEYPLDFSLTLGKSLAFVREPEKQVMVSEGREGRITMRLKALDVLGETSVAMTVKAKIAEGGKVVNRTTSISVRPATPRMTTLVVGKTVKDKFNYPVSRVMYPQYSDAKGSVSLLPEPLITALSRFLLNYPHGCTEQVLSAAFPYILAQGNYRLLATTGEKTHAQLRQEAEAAFREGLHVLNSREVMTGRFGLWSEDSGYYPFLSVYAADFLTRAEKVEFDVPSRLKDRTLSYLENFVGNSPRNLEEARVQAYGALVLTRNGRLVSGQLASLVKDLDARFAGEWKKDITAAHIAACYKMMKQDAEAEKLIKLYELTTKKFKGTNFYSSLSADSMYLSVISNYFPDRLKNSSTQAIIERIITAVVANEYSSVSSVHAMCAISDYSATLAKGDTTFLVTALDDKGVALPRQVTGDVTKTIDLQGAHSIGVEQGKGTYWQISTVGFDREPAKERKFQGMELSIAYLDSKGNQVTKVNQGDEIFVTIRAKSNGNTEHNVAIVSLLPGGFEHVISQGGVVQSADGSSYGDSEYGIEDNSDVVVEEERGGVIDENNPSPYVAGIRLQNQLIRSLGWTTTPLSIVSIDRREERMVIFTTLTTREGVYIYKIKAINKGEFMIPPVYGEAMYNMKMRANTAAGTIIVE